MKYKKEVIITEIKHEDLVNLFSTALYGSMYLDADYPKSDIYEEDDCYEDKLAKALLNGQTIVVRDTYAEGCVYGNLPHEIEWCEEDDDIANVAYKVTLEDVKKGLEKAGSGTFKINFDGEEEFALRAFDSFTDEDACDFDLAYADCLMQIIVFGELIYG